MADDVHKKRKTPSRGAEARWEHKHEGEFEEIIHLGKNERKDRKIETRWSKKEEEPPIKKTRPKGAEERWEHNNSD